MSELHQVIGWGAVGLAAVLVLLAMAATIVERTRSWLGFAWLTTATLIILQGVLGLLLLVSGAFPSDPVHILYGVLIVVLLAGAPVFAALLRASSRFRVLALGAVVAVALAFRLLQTG